MLPFSKMGKAAGCAGLEGRWKVLSGVVKGRCDFLVKIVGGQLHTRAWNLAGSLDWRCAFMS